MNPSLLRQRLSELRIATDLPSEAVSRLVEIGEFRELRSGGVLFREGDENPEFYLLLSGHLGLDMHVPGRGDVRVITLGPGDLVAWSAILGGRMTTSAVALDEIKMIGIDAQRANELCRTDHVFGYHWMRAVALALSRRLLATRLQLLDLFADSTAKELGL